MEIELINRQKLDNSVTQGIVIIIQFMHSLKLSKVPIDT
jgi:hypothetical protein